MSLFHDDTAVVVADGGYRATLSRDWEIWGPNGGYVSAIALRAAGIAAPPDHKPVSISVQYLSVAAFADVDLTVEPIKTGRSAWCLNVVMRQGGKAILQAQVWTTSRTEGPVGLEREHPYVPRPADLPLAETYLPKDAPKHQFWENIAVKPVAFIPYGAVNPDGSKTQQWYRYVGYQNPGGDRFLDAGRALLMIDTILWPSHHRGKGVGKIDYIAPSLDLTVWFHDQPGASEWLLADAHADVAGGGLVSGQCDIWSEDGRLIATGGSQMLHTPSR